MAIIGAPLVEVFLVVLGPASIKPAGCRPGPGGAPLPAEGGRMGRTRILKKKFPKDNELPDSTYATKKVVCPLGLEV